MIGTITMRERGSTPRGLAKEVNNMKRRAAIVMATHFHEALRDRRFTREHAREAGYGLRKGEELARGEKGFRRSYTGRKLKSKGHTLPLVYSGKSRDAARNARLSATATSSHTTARAAYSLSKFNFRHPNSKINMALEFRRIIPREAKELGGVYDAELDKELAANPATFNTKLY